MKVKKRLIRVAKVRKDKRGRCVKRMWKKKEMIEKKVIRVTKERNDKERRF